MKRKHRVVVEMVSTVPVSNREAISALSEILRQQGCLDRAFMIDNKHSPRYAICSWLKSFAYAGGKKGKRLL